MAGELKRLAKKKPEVKMQLKKEDNKKNRTQTPIERKFGIKTNDRMRHVMIIFIYVLTCVPVFDSPKRMHSQYIYS